MPGALGSGADPLFQKGLFWTMKVEVQSPDSDAGIGLISGLVVRAKRSELSLVQAWIQGFGRVEEACWVWGGSSRILN